MAGNITLRVQDHVALVIMDRLPVSVQNAEFRQELIRAFDALTDRDEVRVAILTGTGKMFSAGADMRERPKPDLPGEYWHIDRMARECFNAIHEFAIPVIAAVNRPALGAGLGPVAACDIILCSDNAVLGMPEIGVGLACGAALLQTLFGRSRARRMFYTGWRVPAEELYRMRVAECCVPPAQLLPEAMNLAEESAGKTGWHPICQAIDEHDHAYAATRPLSLRIRHYRHAEQDRGRAGSTPCVPGKALPGVQGTLSQRHCRQRAPPTPPGRPILPFAPDWRWLRGRCDSLWYPAMRLNRQPE